MPAWFPRTIADLVAFTPLRIAFLVLVAILARLILHRLITRAVRTAIER
jgi:small conductance mechanosensitive channel